MEAFEDEFTHWLIFGHRFDCRVHLRVYKDLAILRRVAQTASEICNRAGHRVLESPLEADATERCVTVRDADPEAKPVTVLTPFHIQLSNLITHPHRDGFASVASDNQSRSHNRSN